VIVQIETPEGIRNLEAIAAVEGVDILFAGPNDLSATLGHIGQPKHPDVQKFLAEFPRRVAACGKAAGITFVDCDACERAFQQGYRFISFGSILNHGATGMARELARFRAL
jgi:4-hydroxy-2-oxoheptanedioate aldolase